MGRVSSKVSVDLGAGVVVEMQQRVYALYSLLLKNKGKALSTDYLCTELKCTPNSLRVSMVSLRRALHGVSAVVMDRSLATYTLVDLAPAEV